MSGLRDLHAVVVKWTSKKCTEKRDGPAELLFSSRIFFTFSLPSSSLLLKLSIKLLKCFFFAKSLDSRGRIGPPYLSPFDRVCNWSSEQLRVSFLWTPISFLAELPRALRARAAEHHG